MKSMIPKRIQLARTKGYRLPASALSVARPTKWGNTFTVKEYGADTAVRNHRSRLLSLRAIGALDLTELRGRDLACWCKLCPAHRDGLPLGVKCADCDPCHGDSLLELSNQPQ